MKIASGIASNGIVSILSRFATGNRLKLAAISAGVIIAVVFGPSLVENNELIKNNYDAFSGWKGALLGVQYPAAAEDTGMLDQDAVLEETDSDTITDFTAPEPRQSSDVSNDDSSESQTESFVPPTVENNSPSITAPSEFDDSNFSILLSDPKKYIGYQVTITGQVYDVSRLDNSDLNFRIFNLASASPDNSRASVFFQLSNADIKAMASSLQVEDCVTVWGLVHNSAADRNSLDQTIQVPLIEGLSLGEIECIDSALPVYDTIEIDDSLSQYGLSLTAQKVQFADDHVRIRIVAENHGSSSMFIRDRESFMVRGDESYQSTTHLAMFSEYRLDSKLAPESLSEGYLFFEHIDRNGEPLAFRIVVEQVGIAETVRSLFIFTIE